MDAGPVGIPPISAWLRASGWYAVAATNSRNGAAACGGTGDHRRVDAAAHEAPDRHVAHEPQRDGPVDAPDDLLQPLALLHRRLGLERDVPVAPHREPARSGGEHVTGRQLAHVAQ